MKINIKSFDLKLFTKKGKIYYYREQLNDNFFCEIIINNDNLETKVYDTNTLEEYIPFNLKSYQGSLSSELHELVDGIINKLKIQSDIVNDLIKYIKDKYNIDPVYPFPKDDTSFTMNKNKKWFLLYMNVPSKSLNIDSNGNINIINIKLDEEEILDLVDNKIFYKAYHMNKKYWITINLDNITSIDDIAKYIDESYNNIK